MKLRTHLILSSLVLVAWVSGFSQDLRYLVYDKDETPPSVYSGRRERFLKEVGENSVAILFSATEKNRNGDGDYPFRQDDNFYYLTGLKEPGSILVLSRGGVMVPDPHDSSKTILVHELLFVPRRDKRIEQWTGRRYGPDGALALLGMQSAFTVDRFGLFVGALIPDSAGPRLFLAAIPEKVEGRPDPLKPLRDRVDRLKSISPLIEMDDPGPILRRFRAVKDSYEIGLITKAAHISAMAHREAMMVCSPGVTEYQLQAVYEYVFRKMGSEFNAYPCIVGAAENSVILHYETNRRPINDGDIVLADCGAEYHYYASDLTRTFPANGKFSTPQREIYQIVLNAQNGAIALMKPGVSWISVSATADSILEEGLYAIGIIKSKNRSELRRFFPHGLGHAVGLDVHDVNAQTLEAGMIYTVEPGLYIPEDAADVDPKYFNIGVRIEDDILITPEGHTILTAEAPREIDAIESLMKSKGSRLLAPH